MSSLHKIAHLLPLAGSAFLLSSCATVQPATDIASDWALYGGNAEGQRHSELSQIDRSNVSNLAEAWRFDAGSGGLQTTPLVINGVLYGYTTDQRAFALDAATGALLWRFDPGAGSEQPARGMTYWASGTERRLFVTNANNLYALDPATGQPVVSFADGGRLDLRQDLGRDPEQNVVFATTPGVIYGDLLIIGFRTSEGHPAAPGDIRAYDVRTGSLRWSFHTIPHPGEEGHETWPADAWQTSGGANNWAGMVLDEERGIVFVPTGSPAFDFYGADRIGNNLYANSLLALNAATGERIWHFQAVHHDLWDRDFPSPPTLVTVNSGGRRVDAVAQTTKQGFVFLFDRATGEPLFPIEERPVPASTVPGEQSATTQPFPVHPAPFARQHLTEDLLTRRTPEAHAAALAQFRAMRSDGQFTPLGLDQDTVIFPGFDGGAEWGGSAADPTAGVLYFNSNDVPWFMRLRRVTVSANAGRGEILYQEQCAACHGESRAGIPPIFPALVGIGDRLSSEAIEAVITGGKGRMPGFTHLSQDDVASLADYLLSAVEPAPTGSARRELGGSDASRSSYVMNGYHRFTDPDGYPAVAPPWGTLNALDLNTGEYLWRIPLGEYPALVAQGMADTGSENYGGPILTDGGLLFIGATIYDRKFRAFDSRTGQLLWQTRLPYAGTATPITYMAGGRQFVVIAASGQRDRAGPQGSAYVAFALPANPR